MRCLNTLHCRLITLLHIVFSLKFQISDEIIPGLMLIIVSHVYLYPCRCSDWTVYAQLRVSAFLTQTAAASLRQPPFSLLLLPTKIAKRKCKWRRGTPEDLKKNLNVLFSLFLLLPIFLFRPTGLPVALEGKGMTREQFFPITVSSFHTVSSVSTFHHLCF